MIPSEVDVRATMPWSDTPKVFSKATAARIRFDGILVGIICTENPSVDEFMISEEFSGDDLVHWCRTSHLDDDLFQQARRKGSGSGTVRESGFKDGAFGNRSHMAYQLQPDSMNDDRWWFIAVHRSRKRFTPKEQEELELMLQQWQSRFNRPCEPRVARILFGFNNRIVHVDPNGRQMLKRMKVQYSEVITELSAIAAQRWPKLKERRTHDIAVDISGNPWWIRFRRQRGVPCPESKHWYLELRPLEEDELQTVGLVDDLRIAHSLAYIHDHFSSSPTLNDVSTKIHTSSFHFHRLFSEQVGITPKRYILQKQIQMAKWMLRSRTDAISDVAIDSGFASHGHFTSTFRRIAKISPSEYRESARG